MQALFRWLHVIRKRVIIEEKNVAQKNIKIHNCFCKYAIEDNHVALIPN